MLQLLHGTDFPFMRYRRIAYVLSAIVLVVTFVWLFQQGGPRYSVDFTGGTLLQFRTSQAVPADQVRAALEQAGLGGVEVQQLTGEGHEYMLRMKTDPRGTDVATIVQNAIAQRVPGVQVELRRTEQVGPKVGNEIGRAHV